MRSVESSGGPGLRPGSPVTVTLVKQGRPGISYPAEVVSDDGTHLVVRAPWAGPPVRDLGYVRFEEGDVFTEHYWRDRWYSVKQVRDGGGAVKGWYCDVNRPARVRHPVRERADENAPAAELVVDDLDLDLWVSADRVTILRLDEEEFLASGLAERDPCAARRAREALDELERAAHSGDLPPSPGGSWHP